MTTTLKRCPKCGATVPSEAPQGLCPRCVLAEVAVDPPQRPVDQTDVPSLERVAKAFPQLEVVELIGRGGMGFVFKARQPHLDRFVALKLLPDKLAGDPNFAERFGREGRVLARLNHPNIVSVFDFGQAGGFYFLMMEFVDGVNLRQAMGTGKFSPAEALTIVPKICEALQYAHEKGVLHRDIKPENILLDANGRVKIADFGIAKLVGEDKPAVTLTGTGTALGTPHYMAPEQLEKPGDIDHRADIYSLGVVFYEMLTGELPIGRFKPPSARTPLDERIDEIVLRALERERELRQKNATEFKTQVEHVASHPTPPGESAGGRGPHGTAVVATETPKVVKRTAQVLLGVGIFNWIGSIVIVSLLLFTKMGDRLPIPSSMHNGLELMPILVFSSLIILGALKMMRLETYPLAITASVLAMITTPGNIAGLPVGIWSLITLCRKDVRAAFAQRRRAEGLGAPPMRMDPSRYSHKAIWAASLAGASLLVLAFIVAGVAFRLGGIGPAEKLLVVAFSVAAFVGTILGWVAMSDIRAHQERLRGLPLAAFGALAWPVVVLLTAGVFAASPYIYYLRGANTQMPLPALFLMAVAAGLPTFAIWMVYTTTRWASGKQATQQRGVLRWIFVALVLVGVAIVSASMAKKSSGRQAVGELEAAQTTADTNAWVRYTFTAVEFREEDGKRWLAFDYVDHKYGTCQAAFRYESTVVGFIGTTRKSSFLVNENEPPPVRHQRIEFLLPPSTTPIQGQQFRNDLKWYVGKSVKVDVGNEKPLFVLDIEDGTISGSIGAVRPRAVQ
jgi:serine/threonine protein kinase